MILDSKNINFRFKSTKYQIPDIEYWMLNNLKLPFEKFEYIYEEFTRGLKGLAFTKIDIAYYVNDFFKIENNIKTSHFHKFDYSNLHIDNVVVIDTDSSGVINISLNCKYLKDENLDLEFLRIYNITGLEKVNTNLQVEFS